MHEEHHPFIRESIALSKSAVEKGNHPFGAVLVRDGEIILRAENTVETEQDITGHAETNLVRAAFKQFGPDVLKECTLYTSTEPCAMCAGAIFWSGIQRVVFSCAEQTLKQLAGHNDPKLNLPCQELFERGSGRPTVTVIGPVLEAEAVAVHEDYWSEH